MESSFDIENLRFEYVGKTLVALVTLNSVVRRLEITYNDSLPSKLRIFTTEYHLANRCFMPLGMHISNELIKLRLAIGGKRVMRKIMSQLTFEQIKDQMTSTISRETAEDFLDECTEQVESLSATVKRLRQKAEEHATLLSNAVTDYDVIDYTLFDPQPLIDATMTQLVKCIDVACNAVVMQGIEEALGAAISWDTLDTLPYKEIMKVIRKKIGSKEQKKT